MQSASSIQFTETGRQLGHDLYRYKNPVSANELPGSLREGFEIAQATAVRHQLPDRYVRKWLQLRLSAWERGRAFDEHVTPSLLKAMDVETCPVLRIPLTHGTLQGSDWSVDRINNDGAYATNNLAVISTRANKAKGALSFDEVLARAQRSTASYGLEPVEWLRLASLMLGPCFATRPQAAPCLPLVTPIPAYSLRLAMQQVQHVFTARASTQAGKNLLIKHFRPASRTERREARLRQLAETLHVGLKHSEHVHDVWLRDGVMPSLLGWRESLDDENWALAGEVSRQLAGGRVVPRARLGAWALDSRGYLS